MIYVTEQIGAMIQLPIGELFCCTMIVQDKNYTLATIVENSRTV
jgi:hypothetical protein